jgi:iron complex outermembrane receptor protein
MALAQSADQSGQTQAAKPGQAVQLEEVVVTGIKLSLQTAQELKKNSDTIQDSIVADDIGKLPDVTAVDALQRITGVQIGRDLGEGGGSVTIGGASVDSGIEIRGLPQVETTLNGREVFTANGSRVLNFEDIPSSMLAGIDVYKDPTADLLEGGIAGTVDLRTHKPFDFKGLELEASAAEEYGDMVGTTKPQFTALASDRWETGVGDVGALFAFSYQDRTYRQDQTSDSSILTSTTAIPGQTTTLINGSYNTMFVGERKRTGFDGALQWQPAEDLQTYVEASSEELSSYQSQYTFSSAGNNNVVPGSLTTFPGTTDASAVTYTNATAGSVGAWRQETDVDRQIAWNAKWTPGAWTVIGDASYVLGTESLINPAVYAGVNGGAPLMSQSVSTSGPTITSVSGVDMTNLANYGGTSSNYNSYMYNTIQHFQGNEKAFKLDSAYTFDSGFITSLQAGLRFSDRAAEFHTASTFGAVTTANIESNPQWFGLAPFSPLMNAISSTPVEPTFTVFNPQVLRNNIGSLYSAYGIPAPTDSGNSDWSAVEKNYEEYFRVNFGWDIGVPMDGNIGVREVHHADTLNGVLVSGAVDTPVTYNPSENDTLPSLNLRFKLLDDLQLRFAASKAVAYPDFSQIAPSINLNLASELATGGNPNLKPTKANQADTSLEYYFAPAASITWDVFYKKLTDFILQETEQNAFAINGRLFNQTGAINGPSGSVRGTEIAYQQFLDFLPGYWSGIGYQLNYTYAEAHAPTAVAGDATTLPGLSKNTYNIIGIFEKGPWSFRTAYTWRSQFYTSIYSGDTAQIATNPIYTKAFGWLDSSLTYDVTNQWSVFGQGSNLLRTKIIDYYGTQYIPQSFTINDREAVVGFRFKF